MDSLPDAALQVVLLNTDPVSLYYLWEQKHKNVARLLSTEYIITLLCEANKITPKVTFSDFITEWNRWNLDSSEFVTKEYFLVSYVVLPLELVLDYAYDREWYDVVDTILDKHMLWCSERHINILLSKVDSQESMDKYTAKLKQYSQVHGKYLEITLEKVIEGAYSDKWRDCNFDQLKEQGLDYDNSRRYIIESVLQNEDIRVIEYVAPTKEELELVPDSICYSAAGLEYRTRLGVTTWKGSKFNWSDYTYGQLVRKNLLTSRVPRNKRIGYAFFNKDIRILEYLNPTKEELTDGYTPAAVAYCYKNNVELKNYDYILYRALCKGTAHSTSFKFHTYIEIALEVLKEKQIPQTSVDYIGESLDKIKYDPELIVKYCSRFPYDKSKLVNLAKGDEAMTLWLQ